MVVGRRCPREWALRCRRGRRSASGTTSARMYVRRLTGQAARCGVGAHDHGVGDGDDLVDRQTGALGMRPDRLRARRLVDADGAEAAVALAQHVAADPADVVGRPVALGGRAGGRLLEVARGAPAVAAQDHVGLHVDSLVRFVRAYGARRPAGIGRTTRIGRTGLRVFEERQAARRGDRLAARADVELPEDRRHVVVDGARARRTGEPATWAFERPSATSASTDCSRFVSRAALFSVDGLGPRAMPRTPRSRSRRAAIFVAAAAPIARRRECASAIASGSSARHSATAAWYGSPSASQAAPPPHCGRPARARRLGQGRAPVGTAGRRGAATARGARTATTTLASRRTRCPRRSRADVRGRPSSQATSASAHAIEIVQPGSEKTRPPRRAPPAEPGHRAGRGPARAPRAPPRRLGRVALVLQQLAAGLGRLAPPALVELAPGGGCERIERRHRSSSWPST